MFQRRDDTAPSFDARLCTDRLHLVGETFKEKAQVPYSTPPCFPRPGIKKLLRALTFSLDVSHRVSTRQKPYQQTCRISGTRLLATETLQEVFTASVSLLLSVPLYRQQPSYIQARDLYLSLAISNSASTQPD